MGRPEGLQGDCGQEHRCISSGSYTLLCPVQAPSMQVGHRHTYWHNRKTHKIRKQMIRKMYSGPLNNLQLETVSFSGKRKINKFNTKIGKAFLGVEVGVVSRRPGCRACRDVQHSWCWGLNLGLCAYEAHAATALALRRASLRKRQSREQLWQLNIKKDFILNIYKVSEMLRQPKS